MSQVLITPTNTSGAATAQLRFKPEGEFDRIPKEVIEELSRRGYTIVTNTVESTQVLSPTPPTDRTKIWIQTDISGIPLRNGVKVWDVATSAWVALFQDHDAVTLPEVRSGTFYSPAGGSVQTANFKAMVSDDYRITLTPTLFTSGSWQTPPATFPDKFGYFISAKATNLFTATFYGIPTGGLSWEWDIEQRRTES